MLYTTYISNMKKIPGGVKKILVVRIPPNSFDFEKHNDVLHMPELSPSKRLLLDYKYSEDWNYFAIRFKREMEKREDMREALIQLEEDLRKGKDICLVCFEKEHKYCHRYLIAQWAIDKKIIWEEL